jgi:two-component system response regulator LytT
MYKIACCDDDISFLQDFKKTCLEILHRSHISAQFDLYTTFESLYQTCVHNPDSYDLLILDVLISPEQRKNGIDWGKSFRALGINTSIIYVSSSTDYILDGYDVHALRYILKPVDPVILEKVLLCDYKNRIENQRLVLTKGSSVTSVYFRDIFYIERIQHNTHIHSEDSILSCSLRLDALFEQLPADTFIRCHQSFILNLSKVTRISRYEATLMNHQVVPISKTYYKTVQNDFIRYLRHDS